MKCPRDGSNICPECSAPWLDSGEIEKMRARAGSRCKGAIATAATAAAVGGAVLGSLF